MLKKNKVRKNRLKKDPQKRRRRWLGRLLLAGKVSAGLVLLLAASALFVTGYAALTSADYFRTRSIKIFGNHRLSEAQILAQAGIRPGDNLLALNLRLVRQRLLQHEWVADAQVTREIPRSLRIQVSEHEPMARIGWGRQFLIDTSGRIFKAAAADDPKDLPLISGIPIEEVGLEADRPGPALQAALEVLQLSRRPGSPIAFSELTLLRLDPELGVTAILGENQCTIKLGLERFATKFGRFKQLQQQIQQSEEAKEVLAADLTDPDRVVVRLAAGPEAEGASQAGQHKKVKNL